MICSPLLVTMELVIKDLPKVELDFNVLLLFVSILGVGGLYSFPALFLYNMAFKVFSRFNMSNIAKKASFHSLLLCVLC